MAVFNSGTGVYTLIKNHVYTTMGSLVATPNGKSRRFPLDLGTKLICIRGGEVPDVDGPFSGKAENPKFSVLQFPNNQPIPPALIGATCEWNWNVAFLGLVEEVESTRNPMLTMMSNLTK